MHTVQPPLSAQGQLTVSHEATAQALISVAQLLFTLDLASTPVPTTAPWAASDIVKNAIADLKRQINDIVALRFTGAAGPGNKGSSDIPSPGVKDPPKLDSEPDNQDLLAFCECVVGDPEQRSAAPTLLSFGYDIVR
ncbi:hypothetical protein NDU88_005407 [Pleurodeles waltl]|uniref:Uncharacterized protein n=1 Tax=Pleurodeles waltl TaxID=8319 RepID=A0AAV7LL19_PLEWA|nr:hypothetical protein NDU88_005407 [Pleurodeles waltl]